jgi:hypothetical protein
MFISTGSSIDWYRRRLNGRFRHCTDTFVPAYCRAIGVETTVQTIPVLASALSNPGLRFASSGLRSQTKTPALLPGFCIIVIA